MKQIICGQQSGKLTKIGLEQAEKIGQYLHVEGKMFDHIYVSDLGRTMDTLERINSKAP